MIGVVWLTLLRRVGRKPVFIILTVRKRFLTPRAGVSHPVKRFFLKKRSVLLTRLFQRLWRLVVRLLVTPPSRRIFSFLLEPSPSDRRCGGRGRQTGDRGRVSWIARCGRLTLPHPRLTARVKLELVVLRPLTHFIENRVVLVVQFVR